MCCRCVNDLLVLCRLVSSSPLPSSEGTVGRPAMSSEHPSVQQVFQVLKDHLEAMERLHAQLKR